MPRNQHIMAALPLEIGGLGQAGVVCVGLACGERRYSIGLLEDWVRIGIDKRGDILVLYVLLKALASCGAASRLLLSSNF